MSEIIQGDCIEEMQKLDKNSVDAVVTDPPYGLAFMGKSWDDFEPKEFQEFSQKWGEQALRVLKPGGYLLAFCGTRTYHRMVVGLEDAGFTIKDQIDWLYGQGFPKSHDISKAIDKHFDKEDERKEFEKEHWGRKNRSYHTKATVFSQDRKNDKKGKSRTVSKPSTPEAKKWQGWGTALKPSHEPIVVAQKPYENTYAENVLKYGVGGINIDGCRIGIEDKENYKYNFDGHKRAKEGQENFLGQMSGQEANDYGDGRWPANVVLDPVSAEMLDRQSGESKSSENRIRKSPVGFGRGNVFGEGEVSDRPAGEYGDEGGASRFFYSAKAHKSERNAGLEDLEDKEYDHHHTHGVTDDKLEERKDNRKKNHSSPKRVKAKNDIATLKPINLMRWLCRLVTPEDGTVLDPFAGSGTTGCAAEVEGFDYILIEKRERFANVIAPKRIEYWKNPDNWDELKEHEEVPDPKELRNGKLSEFTSS